MDIFQLILLSFIQGLTEFLPVSAGNNPELYRILVHEQPVIHEVGE